jgi:MFS family permease
MTSGQRRIVTAICLITGISLVVGASLTFLVSPMLDDLGLTSEQGSLALALPSIGSLLVVFIAGRLGDRVGHRTVILGASVAFIAGAVIVTAAQGMVMVTAGLVLVGAAATAIQIVALGLLQASVPTGPARVSAFTTFGMVFPAVYLVAPVATGAIVSATSWRWVPFSWALLGLVIPLSALRLLGRPASRLPAGEMWTPFLGGLALACLTGGINSGHDFGWTSPRTWLAFVLALAAVVAVRLIVQSGRVPSLELAPLRRPRLLLLLATVVLVVTANTLIYVTLGLEYLYGQDALAAAIYLVPAQLASVVGAKIVASWLMRRLGTPRAGIALILGFGVSLLSLLAMSASSPLAQLVFSGAVFSLFGFASITVVNAAVMAQAPDGASGAVSAYRGAASSVGGALSVVFLGGAISIVVSTTSLEPIGTLPDAAALANGLQTHGLIGALLAAGAAVAFWAATRQRTLA